MANNLTENFDSWSTSLIVLGAPFVPIFVHDFFNNDRREDST